MRLQYSLANTTFLTHQDWNTRVSCVLCAQVWILRRGFKLNLVNWSRCFWPKRENPWHGKRNG